MRGLGAGKTAGEAIGVPALNGRSRNINAAKETNFIAPAPHNGAVTAVVAGLAAVATLVVLARPASAETRGYVVSWLATATNNPDFALNCPELAKNPNVVKGLENTGRAPDRAAVNGQAVPALDYPDAVQKDPNIETVVGKEYAYGFDLGGPSANKFEDPETHQPVDNQLWRAVGCTKSFQATPPSAPYPEEVSWATMIDTSPGYAIQISGADLSRDGPVTVTLDRTLRHVERDATGGVRSNVTYALDPSPRSHNVLSGEIRNGMLLIKSGTLYLAGDMPFYAQVDLKATHMRMRSETGGKLVGYTGGGLHRLAHPGSTCIPLAPAAAPMALASIGHWRSWRMRTRIRPPAGTG